MIRVHTRYTTGNVVMLAVGVVVCGIAIPLTGMIFGFGENPLKGLQLWCMNLAVLTVVLALPAFVAAFRWPGVSAIAMWVLTALRVIFAIVAGVFGMLFLPILALGLVSAFSSSIAANSLKASGRA